MNLSANRLGPAGVKALVDGGAFTSSLTSVDVGSNNITGEAAEELVKVVLGKPSLEIFCNIPIKQLRADEVTDLNLSGRGVGVPGALVLAELLPVSASP